MHILSSDQGLHFITQKTAYLNIKITESWRHLLLGRLGTDDISSLPKLCQGPLNTMGWDVSIHCCVFNRHHWSEVNGNPLGALRNCFPLTHSRDFIECDGVWVVLKICLCTWWVNKDMNMLKWSSQSGHFDSWAMVYTLHSTHSNSSSEMNWYFHP